ncbi:hypothetical protein BMF89_00785 [Arthrobacter sp. SRS-W-1-2016]|uniref:hypothetical protein n=1 Tax=Arthrobacter sp. SRS-W-1-2016 TaxID=1930254 RepID=UPI0009914E51|nr:hypothetical protein [Arthrobacter sp. SRS-W-1-2016]OOP64969.1 hypothetical protein BMF89_00785 [Arthrobacter sp. SRS-W-1-2016]
MSYIAVSRRTARRRESEQATRRLVVILSISAAAAWLASVLMVATTHVVGVIHTYALIAHILAMVVSFGAILLVDWHGFLWLIGRRGLAETLRLDGAATPLIWGGLAGLLGSGVFLDARLSSPLTDVKLLAVLVLTLNGIMLIPLMRRLAHLPPSASFLDLTQGQRFHMLSCLAISQLCWWTAIVIGFINAASQPLTS